MERLTNRQKVFLCLADELSKDGKSSRFMIEKGLFLLRTEECMDKFIKFYNFFPYRYGPFSNISFLDMNRLLSQNLLEGDKKLAITPLGKKALNNLDPKIANLVIKTAHRFGSESQIKEYVYEKYPWYTIKSETPKMGAKKAGPGILTIGYEGRDIDEFLNTLLKEGVEVLIDVRYNPFSMKFSFTKNKLKNYLENVGIEYVHMPELGIRGEKRKNRGAPPHKKKKKTKTSKPLR